MATLENIWEREREREREQPRRPFNPALEASSSLCPSVRAMFLKQLSSSRLKSAQQHRRVGDTGARFTTDKIRATRRGRAERTQQQKDRCQYALSASMSGRSDMSDMPTFVG